MRKEVLFAIIFGGIFGVSLAFGAWKLNSRPTTPQSQSPAPIAASKQTNGITTTAMNSNGLSITSPLPSTLIKEAKITLTGNFEADKPIIVSTETRDFFTRTTSDSSFTMNLDTKAGLNSLVITGFGSSKAQIESLFTYSTATASENAQVLIGRITDKTDTGFQVDSVNGQVVQVSVDPNKTSYVSMITTTRDVTFADVGIGDYVSVIGSPGTQNIFNAERVIMTTTPVTENRKAYQGTVKNLTRNQFTFSTEGQDLTIKSGGTVTYSLIDQGTLKTARFSSIEDGQQIITVGKVNGSAFEPRTVFILQ